MIHKISIENFFSIADRQEITFKVAENVPDMAEFRPSRALPDTRLPAVIGVFGPNASGKSTLLRALVSAIAFAAHSFALPVGAAIPWFQSYMRKDWSYRPSTIVIEFDGYLDALQPPTLFRYQLQIGYEKDITGYTQAKTVLYEGLFHSPKGRFRKIFEREEQNFSFGEEFGLSGHNRHIKTIRPNASIVSTLAQLNHPISINFKNSLAGVQTNVAGVEIAQNTPDQLLPYYSQRPNYLANLNKQLRRLDVGLEEMIIDNGPTGLFAKFRHTGLDMPILMNGESSGTKRFIEMFARLEYVLETGSIAVIDELDIYLHPLLMPEIFRWFNDSVRNQHGAQLFFTAHNPALLDEIEKEQIFFTQKDSGKPSIVYGARDFKGLRREPSLMKKYLAGELGAVPHLG